MLLILISCGFSLSLKAPDLAVLASEFDDMAEVVYSLGNTKTGSFYNLTTWLASSMRMRNSNDCAAPIDPAQISGGKFEAIN